MSRCSERHFAGVSGSIGTLALAGGVGVAAGAGVLGAVEPVAAAHAPTNKRRSEASAAFTCEILLGFAHIVLT
jgi:hypothetical protein